MADSAPSTDGPPRQGGDRQSSSVPAPATAPFPMPTPPPPPQHLPQDSQYYSIDVECVATDTTHNARAVAHIAMVDQYERVIFNAYVKPSVPVVSYLTPLTGCAVL
mmetsp:Transcript_33278/g.94274  ORF Transcript_33278/g.94274 Transcript_33278/m.94274 type:complete len:106 (+) Transcript_33278:282-599(+)